MLDAPGIGVYCPNKDCDVLDNPIGYMQEQEEKKQSMKFNDPGEHPSDRIEYEEEAVEEPKPHHPDTHPYLRQGFKYPEGWMFGAPLVATPEESTQTAEEILDEGLKSAKKQWKSVNPNDTIKRQETLYEAGLIDQLPWETVEELDARREEKSKKKTKNGGTFAKKVQKSKKCQIGVESAN